MARPLCIQIESGLCHVTSRGWDRLLARLEAQLRISVAPVGSGKRDKQAGSRQKLKVKT